MLDRRMASATQHKTTAASLQQQTSLQRHGGPTRDNECASILERVGREQDGWAALEVADEVGVEPECDGAGDEVSARGQVHNGRVLRGELRSAAGLDGGVDGGCVVGHTIALCAVVLHSERRRW